MIKPPSFYVVYPENQELRDLLNALKLIADENQRTEAHITVRGPYLKQLKAEEVSKFSSIISGEILEISNVDNFFAFNQNTVFFSCENNEKLRAVWKKITYNDFKPHITLYDGKDREFAIKLYRELSSNFKPFKYKVSELSWLEPKSKDTLKLFYLKGISEHNPILKEVLNFSKERIDFSKLTQQNRLTIIARLAKQLSETTFD